MLSYKVNVRVHILDPAALTNKFASTPCLFGRMATLGRETLQLCLRTYWGQVSWVRSPSVTSLWYSLTRIRAMRRVGWVRSLTLLGTPNIWCDSSCADPLRLGVRGRTRRGEGNCKSTYIRSRRACEQVRKHSVSFWPNGDVRAGNVTVKRNLLKDLLNF